MFEEFFNSTWALQTLTYKINKKDTFRAPTTNNCDLQFSNLNSLTNNIADFYGIINRQTKLWHEIYIYIFQANKTMTYNIYISGKQNYNMQYTYISSKQNYNMIYISDKLWHKYICIYISGKQSNNDMLVFPKMSTMALWLTYRGVAGLFFKLT